MSSEWYKSCSAQGGRQFLHGKKVGEASSLGLVLVLLLLHGGDELPDTEVLDEGLEDGIAVDLDVLELDLGLFWDKVHLSFSLLL